MKECIVSKCRIVSSQAVSTVFTSLFLATEVKFIISESILLESLRASTDDLWPHCLLWLNMIYMPSLMRLVGDTVNESTFFSPPRALAIDGQKQGTTGVETTGNQRCSDWKANHSTYSARHPLHRCSPGQHRHENRPLVPMCSTEGSVHCRRPESSENECHFGHFSKYATMDDCLDQSASLYSLRSELRHYNVGEAYVYQDTAMGSTRRVYMGTNMECATKSAASPCPMRNAWSLPQLATASTWKTGIPFPDEPPSMWHCHKNRYQKQDKLADYHPSSGSESQLLIDRLKYFPQFHRKILRRLKDDQNKTETVSHCQLLSKGPISEILPFISGSTACSMKDKPTILIEKKAPRNTRESKPVKVKARDWIRQSKIHISKARRRLLRSLKGETSIINLTSGQTDFNGLWRRDTLSTYEVKTDVAASNEHALSPSSDSPTSVACNQRVVINVSGLRFETWLRVLESHPTTLLGNRVKRQSFWDECRKEYFFDRHRPSFEAIFNYYQHGGRIKRPAVVADDIFLRELEFFEIEDQAVQNYKKNEGYVPEVIILPTKAWKRKLWLLFEYPEASVLAFCFSVASLLFTITSIILFCVETLPVYAQTHCEPGDKPNFLDPFFIIETICTFWFTLELIVRFLSCPSRKSFVKDVKNLIDLAAIVPYYITLANVLSTFSCEGAKSSASLAFLRVIRLIRVFKLTKHSSGLQVLVLTFKESVEGLGLFLVAFIVCILLFSSTIYYVEVDRKGSQIESIPDAFWWAVITMCTVGYGDKVPKGPLGKIVGGVCAVAGVLTLAIPVPIITENFNKFYAHKTGRGVR